MGLAGLLPKVAAPKKVVLDHWKLNALYYVLHLPILAYAIFIFEYQKQYTEVLGNAPFLMLNVNTLDITPYEGIVAAQDPDPSIAGWCTYQVGGPFWCHNSTDYIRGLCLGLSNEDVMNKVQLETTLACSRLCDLGGLMARDCFLPPTQFLQSGSRTLTIVPFTAQGRGLVTGLSGEPLLVLVHSIVRYARVEFSYVFQMSQSPPFFFGLYEQALGRKDQRDAYTVVINRQEEVKHFFPPNSTVVLTPPEILEAAGRPWNIESIMRGGEFYAVVNCYNDGYDLSTALNWGSFTYVAPSPLAPMCIMTVEELRSNSVATTTDAVADITTAISRFRIDTGTGSSHHRMPSLSAILLNLISLFVLLKVPQTVTLYFANLCLGSLSNVYKRASEETFKLPTRVAQLGLRLVTDSMALEALRNPEASGISEERLKEQLQKVIGCTTAEPGPHLDAIGESYGSHVFSILRQLAKEGHCYADETSPEVHSSQFANLMSLGQSVHIKDLCAYFDVKRRRSWMEWQFIPKDHRQILRGLQKEEAEDIPAPSNSEEEADTNLVVVPSTKEVRTPPDSEVLRKLQARVDMLEAEREANRRRDEDVAQLEAKLQQLCQRLDLLQLEASEPSPRERKPLETMADHVAMEQNVQNLSDKAMALEERVLKLDHSQSKLATDVGAVRDGAQQRQERTLKELESLTSQLKGGMKGAGRGVGAPSEARQEAGLRGAPPSAAPAVESRPAGSPPGGEVGSGAAWADSKRRT